jgi:hypothetical protein
VRYLFFTASRRALVLMTAVQEPTSSHGIKPIRLFIFTNPTKDDRREQEPYPNHITKFYYSDRRSRHATILGWEFIEECYNSSRKTKAKTNLGGYRNSEIFLFGGGQARPPTCIRSCQSLSLHVWIRSNQPLWTNE